MWPEFSTNFNFYWTRRSDLYEQWRSRSSVPAVVPSRSRGSGSPAVNSPFRPNWNVGSQEEDCSGAVRVLEAELVEVSERLRQARYQVDEERQKRHSLRDELDEVRRQLEDERNRHRDVTRQLVILEEDKLTHDIQVSRLRETVEQTVSHKESLQLDLDRVRMQLYHAKEKYETALNSVLADSEAFRKKNELLQLELDQGRGSSNSKDMAEMEAQNAVLRQVIDKYRRQLSNSKFADSADSASGAAFDSSSLSKESNFLNSLMEALDKAKFLNKQMQVGSDTTNNWSKQSWQDLCVGWREAVCELCDLFALAHRIESQINSTLKVGIPKSMSS